MQTHEIIGTLETCMNVEHVGWMGTFYKTGWWAGCQVLLSCTAFEFLNLEECMCIFDGDLKWKYFGHTSVTHFCTVKPQDHTKIITILLR